MNADATIEIPEYSLHPRRQNMNRSSTPVFSRHADPLCFPKQPAPQASLNENKPFLLVFKYSFVPNMKILSKVPAQFFPTELHGQTCFFNLEKTDDVQCRVALEVPSVQSRIEDEQVSLFQFPETGFWSSWITVCECSEFRVIVNRRIPAAFTESFGEIIYQFPLVSPADCISIGPIADARTSKPINNRDELERLVLEQRAMYPPGTCVYSYS